MKQNLSPRILKEISHSILALQLYHCTALSEAEHWTYKLLCSIRKEQLNLNSEKAGMKPRHEQHCVCFRLPAQHNTNYIPISADSQNKSDLRCHLVTSPAPEVPTCNLTQALQLLPYSTKPWEIFILVQQVVQKLNPPSLGRAVELSKGSGTQALFL